MSDPTVNAGAPLSLVEEDPRQLAAKLVNALYRLVKASQLHAETNQAVLQVVDYVANAVTAFCGRANVGSTAILFTPHAVFVNRQMLKASKETYQLALELGTMLEACHVTELTFSSEIAKSDIADFGRAVASVVRDNVPSARFSEGGWEGLKVRRVVGFGSGHNMPPHVRAARTYAAALMILRGFYEDLRQGKYELRQGIKRVAQKLVSQNDLGGRLLLSIAAAPAADADRMGTLLSSAIVSAAMAAQLTTDRGLLTSLVGAALLYDAGRARLAGHGELSRSRNLNADEEAQLPTSSIVALTALGKLHPPNVVRAVIVHEAHAIREGQPLYQGKRTPLLVSRILATARSFAELRTPKPGVAALGIDDALSVLESQAPDNLGRTLVKLLTGALGIFPAGTMVELSSGEMAVVLMTPTLPVDFARPQVRVLYDKHAQLLSEPIDVDLAQPSATPRFVKRPIDATDQQMKQMRAYVMQLATNRARKKSVHKMQAMRASPAAETTGAPATPVSAAPLSPISAAPLPPPSRAPDSSHPAQAGSRAADSLPPDSSPPDSSEPSSKPTMRPPTKRWDPRSEEAAAPKAGPLGVNAPNRKPTLPLRGETRSVSWDEYGKELASSTGRPAPVIAEVESNETDAILAAYLAEDANNAEGDRPSSQGSSSGRSWGLRWTQRATGSGDAPSSSGNAYGSSAGGSSSGGLAQSWGTGRNSAAGPPSSGGAAPPSSQPRGATPADDDPFAQVFSEGPSSQAPAMSVKPPISSASARSLGASLSARPATGPSPVSRPVTGPNPMSVRPATGPSPTSSGRRVAGASSWAVPRSDETPPPSHADPEPTPPEDSVERPVPSVSSPASKRVKAGSQAWGAKRNDKK